MHPYAARCISGRSGKRPVGWLEATNDVMDGPNAGATASPADEAWATIVGSLGWCVCDLAFPPTMPSTRILTWPEMQPACVDLKEAMGTKHLTVVAIDYNTWPLQLN